MSTLVRSEQPADDLERLRARIAEGEAELATRAAEADRLRRELDVFAAHYRQQVGTLHEQLDELELDIAEAEAGELSRLLADRGARRRAAPPPPPPESAPRFTSDAVRKLFRDVAKAVHPDLARDEHARDRRHALMVEANRAYGLGDAERLRRILDQWARSPEAVEGDDGAAARLRLERRLAEIEERSRTYDEELAALKASPLYELKTMVDEAAGKGRDLVAEMVARLKRDILVATNRLDAMRSTP